MTLYLRPGEKSLRNGRVSIPDQVYFITFVCDERKRIFTDWECALGAVKILTEERLWRNSKLLCWVLMPDHWHGLVQLADEESLSKLVQRVKAVSAKNINIVRSSSDSVWLKCFLIAGCERKKIFDQSPNILLRIRFGRVWLMILGCMRFGMRGG